MTTQATTLDTTTSNRIRRTARTKALRLVVFATLLEAFLIMPFVDHYADTHPTVHFTQHGFIFLGGLLMGWALREVHRYRG